ncbi:MAG: glycosyltransferase [Sciscionella sp.]
MTTPKHVLIIAVGSRGDVAPCTGVGARLLEAGYTVTIAADKAYAELVTDAGLHFEPLGTDLGGDRSEASRGYARDGLFSRSGVNMVRAATQFVRTTNGKVADVASDCAADILLLNPLASAGYHVAQARGIPSLGVHLQPQQPTRELPPMVIGRSLGRFGNRATGRLLRLSERMFFAGINDIRADCGLSPTTLAATYREQAAQQWPILHGISRHVVPRPSDWRPGLDIVGYWWPATPAGWTPPERLRQFLDAGDPPVFVGFGSTDPGQSEQLSHTVTTALRRAGRRGIIQAGWAELTSTDDDMLTIDDVPHEWLFPRTAAVVHAASAGVTAAGLRAGIPAVPIPMTGDQPFWARRLTSLGVSPAAVPVKRLSTDRLGAALREAIGNPAYRDRAATLKPGIGAEDGAGRVLEAINALT